MRLGSKLLWVAMIHYTQKNEALVFTVLATPRASRTQIVGEHDGALRVKLKAAPVDGAANKELIRILAKEFGVSRNNIEIASGHSSKRKNVRVSGPVAQLVETLNGLTLDTGVAQEEKS